MDRVEAIAACLDAHMPGWADGIVEHDGEWYATCYLLRAYVTQRRERAGREAA